MKSPANMARMIREAELEKLRIEAAINAGLPVDLSDWLRGESSEALAKDAQEMLAVLPKLRAAAANRPPKKTESRTARKIRRADEAQNTVKAALGH